MLLCETSETVRLYISACGGLSVIASVSYLTAHSCENAESTVKPFIAFLFIHVVTVKNSVLLWIKINRQISDWRWKGEKKGRKNITGKWSETIPFCSSQPRKIIRPDFMFPVLLQTQRCYWKSFSFIFFFHACIFLHVFFFNPKKGRAPDKNRNDTERNPCRDDTERNPRRDDTERNPCKLRGWLGRRVVKSESARVHVMVFGLRG